MKRFLKRKRIEASFNDLIEELLKLRSELMMKGARGAQFSK